MFEEGSFVPQAKLQNGKSYSIITDHLGTPTDAYDEKGKKVWSRELDIYGKTRKFTGESNFVPFTYQGQYFDEEVELAYNRFRWYSSDSGTYISQDPIGLQGGMQLYSYVPDVNSWIDPLGLMAKNSIIVSMNSSLVDVPVRGVHVNVNDGKTSIHVEIEGVKTKNGYKINYKPADPTAKNIMQKKPSKWNKIKSAVSDFVSKPKNSKKLSNIAEAAAENFPNNKKDFTTTADALKSGCH